MRVGGAIARLVKAWALMGGLTAAAVVAGRATGSAPPGALFMAVLMVLTWLKAAVLMDQYLDLRHARAWNVALRVSLGLLLAVLYGLALIAG